MRTKFLTITSWGVILLFLFMTNCTNKENNNFSLETVHNDPGAGNAFIDSAAAVHLRHEFDAWHRNRQYYNDDGTPKPGCPPRDATQDGDITIPPDNNANVLKINDSLTKSVWIHKDVLAYLSYLIQTNNCDGVRIYFAAYDTAKSAPGQLRAHQATIYMVPTDSIGITIPGKSRHADNYRIVHELLEQFYQLKGSNGGGLNHGELCPTYCP